MGMMGTMGTVTRSGTMAVAFALALMAPSGAAHAQTAPALTTQSLECVMDNEETLALELDPAAQACSLGDVAGQLEDGMCEVDDPNRRLSYDPPSGALVIENTETGDLRRGVCGPG